MQAPEVLNGPLMNFDWSPSPAVFLVSFPLLYLVLLGFVHVVIEFAPHTIRKHRVSYRPIRTRFADLLLIVRLAFQRN
jgi:hypothetical protein